MREDYLLMLADHLEVVVHDVEFDIEVWKCGTVACAVGHATTIFPELKLVQSGDSHDVVLTDGCGAFGLCGWDAVMHFFKLEWGETRHLFYGGAYPNDGVGVTRHIVAERIRDFVASGGVLDE